MALKTCEQKGCSNKKVPQAESEFLQDGKPKKDGSLYKGCRNCRNKANRKRINKANMSPASSEGLPSRPAAAKKSELLVEFLRDRPATRSQSREGKKCRSEANKQRAYRLHSGRCGISGKDGSSIEVAHHIPWKENDTPENMFTLQASLHRELDAFVFALDPFSREGCSVRKGFDVYQLVYSDKPNNENPVCKDYTECMVRIESYEFIVEAHKRFIESEFPEETSVVGAPTRDYKSLNDLSSSV
jgi:hypothetical protein